MQERSQEESDPEPAAKRQYRRPEVHDFFDPAVAVVTATYVSGPACAAPPKMPPP